MGQPHEQIHEPHAEDQRPSGSMGVTGRGVTGWGVTSRGLTGSGLTTWRKRSTNGVIPLP